MIIDAMDLLYSNKFDAFALVSSDSDFTKLASRLKESQIYVFGVGENKTPLAFRNACDDFIHTEVLRAPEVDEVIETVSTKQQLKSDDSKKSKRDLCCDTRLINILRNSVRDNADADGWAHMGACGALIKRQYPDFDSRTYGYPSFTKLYEATELFEVDRRKSGSARASDVYVKDKRA